jgi:DnaJ domain/DnaJ central domain/DnaJ C terminal domain
MTTEVDYYELLECDRGADAAAIKSAYRKLAIKYHPDKNGGCTNSEAKFKAVSEAYDCLKDPQKRAAYDRFGHAAFKNGMGGGGNGAQDFGGFSDIFESVFGEFMGGRGGGRTAARRGADLRYDLEVTLEEAFHGKQTEVTIEVSAPCEPCGGSGAKPGTSAKQCPTCAGHGKVRAQQGFFVVERACPSCHGAGQVIADPCTACRGEGRVDKPKTLSVNVPAGVDEGTRIRLTIGRSLHLPARRAAPHLRARGHDAAGPLPGQLHHRGAGRNDRYPRPRWVDQRGAHSGGHSVRQADPPARRGRARAARPRPRRHGCPDRRRDPDAAERAAEGTARPVPRDRNGRGMPSIEGLLCQDQGRDRLAKYAREDRIDVLEVIAEVELVLEFGVAEGHFGIGLQQLQQR